MKEILFLIVILCFKIISKVLVHLPVSIDYSKIVEIDVEGNQQLGKNFADVSKYTVKISLNLAKTFFLVWKWH